MEAIALRMVWEWRVSEVHLGKQIKNQLLGCFFCLFFLVGSSKRKQGQDFDYYKHLYFQSFLKQETFENQIPNDLWE